jgi:hypothetical protein
MKTLKSLQFINRYTVFKIACIFQTIILDYSTLNLPKFVENSNLNNIDLRNWVIEWLLFNVNSAIFQLYHGENKLIFNEMMMTITLSWIFIVLVHWNNSPRVDMSLHSDTLFWFRANQSLLFLYNAAC